MKAYVLTWACPNASDDDDRMASETKRMTFGELMDFATTRYLASKNLYTFDSGDGK